MMRALLLMLALPLVCAAAPIPEVVLGPFRLGQTYEEARSANPTLNVTDVLDTRTRQVISIEALNAVTVLDQPYTARMRPLPGDWHEMVLFSRAMKLNTEGCRKQAQAAVPLLETQVGPLAPLAVTDGLVLIPLLAGQRTIDLGGSRALGGPAAPSASGGKILTTGKSALAEITLRNGETAWVGGIRAKGSQRLDAFVWAVTSSKGQTCASSVQVRFTPVDYPAVEWTTFTNERASIGARHHSLDGVSPFTQPATVEATCEINRVTKRAAHCMTGGRDARTFTLANDRLLRTLTANVPHPEPALPTLIAKQTVTYSPSDRRPVGSKEALAARVVTASWARQPDGGELRTLYPVNALISKINAEVTLRCQIQSDGSLICPEIVSTQTGLGFEAAALSFALMYRAAPKLADGASSTGAWVDLEVPFVAD